MLSNTQRTLHLLRSMGRSCGIVERFIHNKKVGPGIRSDLYGFIDIIAIKPGEGIYGVQSCGADFKAHYNKIVHDKRQEAIRWLKSGGMIEIISWRKLKTGIDPRIYEITLEDFDDE